MNVIICVFSIIFVSVSVTSQPETLTDLTGFFTPSHVIEKSGFEAVSMERISS